MKGIITVSIFALAISISSGGLAKEAHHGGHEGYGTGKAIPAEEAVRHEMRLLDAAFKNLLDSILLNTPEAIEAPFHEVHGAKMVTEKALHSGKVTLPKNGDKLEEFVALDEEFHGKLKKLLGAARKKDNKGIQEAAHEILDGCIQCHSRFRN